jgi:O-methyltransferase
VKLRNKLRDISERTLPAPLQQALRHVYKGAETALRPHESAALLAFLFRAPPSVPISERINLIRRMFAISWLIPCPHLQQEMFAVMQAALTNSAEGVIVEAGSFKGGSTAKLSLVAKLAGRRLIVFDSFEGLPDHDERHGKTIFGERTDFAPRSYCGALEEVTENIRRFGQLSVCEFRKGWFEDTMPLFREPIAAAYIDVDLVSSTRTCLKHLYPLLVPGGAIFSQDGHLPLVTAAIGDTKFWETEIGYRMPPIEGLGTRKLLKIEKPFDSADSCARDADSLALNSL